MNAGPNIPPAQQSDDLDRRDEVRLEQGVVNSFMVQGIAKPVSGQSAPEPHHVRVSPPRHRTMEPRGGDAEADLGEPSYYKPYVAPTEAELAERRAGLTGLGHEQAMAIGNIAFLSALDKETQGESEGYRRALLRAAKEKRARPTG